MAADCFWAPEGFGTDGENAPVSREFRNTFCGKCVYTGMINMENDVEHQRRSDAVDDVEKCHSQL